LNARSVRFSGKIVSSNTVKGLRNYSTKRGSLKINPEKLALDQINSGSETTYLIINKILAGQKVSITANKLRDLKKIKGVEIDLSLNDTETFKKLVGGSTYKGFPGVYMFIHKVTNQTYIGSSNLFFFFMTFAFASKAKGKQKTKKLIKTYNGVLF